MYPNQAFSSGSYAEMMSANTLLPHNYNESVGGQNELKFISSIGDTMTMQPIDHSTSDPSRNSYASAEDSHVISRTQFGLVESDQNVQCQGLSLSLGTMMPSIASVPAFQYQYPGNGFSALLSAQIPNLKGSSSLKDDEAECMASLSSGGFHNTVKREGLYTIGLNEGQSDPCLHGSSSIPNNVLNSHYVKAAQELLDEIVNVRKALKQSGFEKQQSLRDTGLDGSKDSDGKSTSQSMQISSGPNGSNANNSSSELSPAERQLLLDKKTKLLSMLDEVNLCQLVTLCTSFLLCMFSFLSWKILSVFSESALCCICVNVIIMLKYLKHIVVLVMMIICYQVSNSNYSVFVGRQKIPTILPSDANCGVII